MFDMTKNEIKKEELIMDANRIENVHDEAQLAYWAVVAEKFQDIATGDLDPVSVAQFDEAGIKAITDWYEANKPSKITLEEFRATRRFFTDVWRYGRNENEAEFRYVEDYLIIDINSDGSFTLNIANVSQTSTDLASLEECLYEWKYNDDKPMSDQ